MKLRLPVMLCRAVLAVLTALTVSAYTASSVCFAEEVDEGAGDSEVSTAAMLAGDKSITLRLTDVESFSLLEGFSGLHFEGADAGITNAGQEISIVARNEVSFSGNAEVALDVYGGSILNSGTLSINENKGVAFSDNSVAMQFEPEQGWENHRVGGGAIGNSGCLAINNNDSVDFSDNAVSLLPCEKTVVRSHYQGLGAAIANFGETSMKGNQYISFDGNSVIWEMPLVSDFDYSDTIPSPCLGGAVYNAGSYVCADADSILFRDNSVSGSVSNATTLRGGAVYNADAAVFALESNRVVDFSGNSCSVSSVYDETVPFYVIVSGGGAVCNDGIFRINGNDRVSFNENFVIAAAADPETVSFPFFIVGSSGGAIATDGMRFTEAIFREDPRFTLNDNGKVEFVGNYARAFQAAGGAISNGSSFAIAGNDCVIFRDNSVIGEESSNGGAICSSWAPFSISGNKQVDFLHNSAVGQAAKGGAIFKDYTMEMEYGSFDFDNFKMIGNGSVVFIENSAREGGAVYNSENSLFVISGNDSVIFRDNKVAGENAQGGAIYNIGELRIVGNGDVLFERNVEIISDTYRLRSVYSKDIEGVEGIYFLGATPGISPELNLSAAKGHRITFRDSVYAEGIVNLNEGGMGDVIFSGATTEADLRAVKGGIEGTAAEILSSRTSELLTNATLFGGRLVVEHGAVLKGQGITMTEGSNAAICLNDGTLDESGYDIVISTCGGLEFEGYNVLKAATVKLADGAQLSFTLGESSGVAWDARLISSHLNIQVSGDLFNEHQLLTLQESSQYDTSGWTSDSVTVKGVSFESLHWNAGVLTYAPNVITPGEDGALDGVLPDDGDAIIDGGGHSLSVKNSVQLVQMALKDGTVKLEGENNNIVSVTLTDGGELILSAGAGLKAGDIISMVANGSAELVISGDITINKDGMKGKHGTLATVSHADAKVGGDAEFCNVRVENSVIDLTEGSTVDFTNVVLSATTHITDDPATLRLDGVLAELVMEVNTTQKEDGILTAETVLAQLGDEETAITLAEDATVLMLESDTFDSLTLGGTSLQLELSGLSTDLIKAADYIGISFKGGTAYATFDTALQVTLSINGHDYGKGYAVEGESGPVTIYFSVPEPATATLSLLALAALCARRCRK